MVSKGFENAARSYARAYKLPSLRLLLLDDTLAHQGGDALAATAAGAIERVVGEWAGKAAGEGAALAGASTWSPVIAVEGDFLDANRLLLEKGLTDGLPVIPPTPRLVERFVAASGRPGSEIVARAHAAHG